MNLRRLQLREKIQVQAASAAGLAAVYFLVWPLFRPGDPAEPPAFLPAGTFLACAVVMAAACALATLSSRPEGTLLAAVVALGGLSLRAQPMRALLWRSGGSLSQLYAGLLAELAWVLASAAAIVVVIDGVRLAIRRLLPAWSWHDPFAGCAAGESASPPTGPSKARKPASPPEAAPDSSDTLLLGLLGLAPVARKPRSSRQEGLVLGLSSFLLGTLVSLIALTVVLQSTDRGQVLFALVGSFMLGAFVARRFFPSPHALTAWAMPLAAGAVYYVLSSLTAGAGSQAWKDLPRFAAILPIDWLTAGCGGAAFGFWISCRMLERKHLEREEETAD